MQNPIVLLARASKLALTGRLRRERDLRDLELFDKDERFTAFRKVVVDPPEGGRGNPGAVFRVRFHFKNLSEEANRRLSLFPIPFIVAQPGFRSKTWLTGERTRDFMGLYEFDTIEDAEAYWTSLPLGMMRGRAAPGTLRREVHAIS